MEYVIRKGGGTTYHIQRKRGVNTLCHVEKKNLHKFQLSSIVPSYQKLCKSCARELGKKYGVDSEILKIAVTPVATLIEQYDTSLSSSAAPWD